MRRRPSLVAAEIGFPLLLKAAGGGGGRGMRVATEPHEFAALFAQASAEAASAFGNPEIYLERFFARVRHIEIQVFGDQPRQRHPSCGSAIAASSAGIRSWSRRRRRRCSTPRVREQMAEAATALIRNIKYEGAGTVEFIYDLDSGRWFFIEMNTRIQVEHPVTEEIFGVDLVAEQMRVAAGEPISLQAAGARRTGAVRSNSASMPRIRPTIFGRRPARCPTWSPPSGPGRPPRQSRL